ncbi:MAG: hypothetical protein AB7H92_13780 [Microbacteriaceae bacterium]
MRAVRAATALLLIAAAVYLGGPAGASGPGQCVSYSPLGYCVDWDVPTPGGPPAGRGVSTGRATCYWVTITEDLSEDPSIWFDFELTRPPEGVTVVWQTRVCTDGSAPFTFRWVIPATPANLAAIARGRVLGTMPQPSINSSPPVGTASIVEVPVFVEVTNWTGVVTDSECAGGVCVTVTATPQLTFTPGEAGSSPVACAGSGTRYEPDGAGSEAQASADGACTYTYRLRTGVDGRPARWSGSVSVTWAISWTASSGATGSLPAVTRTTSLPRAVREVQAVVVRGETA